MAEPRRWLHLGSSRYLDPRVLTLVHASENALSVVVSTCVVLLLVRSVRCAQSRTAEMAVLEIEHSRWIPVSQGADFDQVLVDIMLGSSEKLENGDTYTIQSYKLGRSIDQHTILPLRRSQWHTSSSVVELDMARTQRLAPGRERIMCSIRQSPDSSPLPRARDLTRPPPSRKSPTRANHGQNLVRPDM